MDHNREKIAYFCMEYGLDQKLPLYAGGLGILAGDYLKAAQDINAPIVGIGILWWQDYTQQFIDDDGYPYDTFPTHNFDSVQDTGVSISVKIEDEDVNCKIYKVDKLNNKPLYLLDTGKPDTKYGWISDKLYSGDDYKRLAQEMVLGIGGIKALRALNIEVDKYHFNEGHAAFAGFELIREKMHNENMSFSKAYEITRNEIVFTTHTPVPAGNESHDPHLIMEIGANNDLSLENLIEIGGNPFNMTAACLHMSSAANGVSKLHGETAREMWEHLDNIPYISSITNGVHQNTWQDHQIKMSVDNKSDLWQAHYQAKQRLAYFIKEKTNSDINPDNLIIGFARRAAPYKRSELIFRNTDKIDDLLSSGKIQLVFSGKAHPNDKYGKEIVATLVKMDQKYKDNVVFLENYNIEICRHLIQGCDVWLNNPKRPMEASGTSGMKSALNGILNLSVLDGWIAEGVEHDVHGWILDEAYTEQISDDLDEDERDLKALYRILREKVIPIYYDDRERWISMMQASIKMAQKKFTSARMLREYYDLMYRRYLNLNQRENKRTPRREILIK